MIRTHTVRIDAATGLIDARKLVELLYDVEEYIAADHVDRDDDAAVLAVNVLARHFGGSAAVDTSEEDWAR